MKTSLLMLFFFLLFSNFVFAKSFFESLMEIQKAAQMILAENEDPKGKLTDLIKQLEDVKIEDNDESKEESEMMKNKVLGELCSKNGDYDKSNVYIKKVAEKIPHSTFYKQMIVNMLLKGDKEAALKIKADFEKLIPDVAENEDDQKRQLKHIQEAFDEHDKK